MSQAGLKPMKNSPIGSLNFFISLGMGNRGKSLLDVELDQEFFEPPIIKLSVVIYDDHSRKTISTNDGFLDEGFDLTSIIWATGLASIHLLK